MATRQREIAMSGELELDPCKHGEQNKAFCSICKGLPDEQRKIVYFTSGGQHFHFTPRCSALADRSEYEHPQPVGGDFFRSALEQRLLTECFVASNVTIPSQR